MLSQKYRFHSRGGVNYVYQKGKSIRTANFSLVYTSNPLGRRRFAVVVSKKILKLAVGRNRIRRRVYEAIRLEFTPDLPPMDFIFVVHNRAVIDQPFRELRREVSELISRAVSHP